MDKALIRSPAASEGLAGDAHAAAPYQALTFDLCESLARLANPAHGTELTPALYQQAVSALSAARAEAMGRADKQPLAAAQQTIRFALALTAAIATLDLLLATP